MYNKEEQNCKIYQILIFQKLQKYYRISSIFMIALPKKYQVSKDSHRSTTLFPGSLVNILNNDMYSTTE